MKQYLMIVNAADVTGLSYLPRFTLFYKNAQAFFKG